MASVVLRLPWPPSVNHYWHRNENGTMRVSTEGRSYRNEVAWIAMRQKPYRRATFRGPLSVAIVAVPPDRRTRDIDNILKAPLDALRFAAVYLDDCQVRQLSISLTPGVKKPGTLDVVIQEFPAWPEYREPKPPAPKRSKTARLARGRGLRLPAGSIR